MHRCLIGVLLLVVSVLFSGCADFVTVQAKGAQVQAAAPKVASATVTAIEASEPVIDSLESATGKTLSDATLTKGESIAIKTAGMAEKIQAVGSVISAVPGPQQPFLLALTAVAGAVTGVAGGIGSLMARRREKNALRALDTALIAGVEADKFGANVTQTAAIQGTSALIQERYVASGAEARNDAYPAGA
jgi:hypothetical protein